MKVREKSEIVEAVQWFPGKEVPEVKGTKPNKWCGCVIVGGPPDVPHIHIAEKIELVEPGDWIITNKKGKRCLVKPDVFEKIYEKI